MKWRVMGGPVFTSCTWTGWKTACHASLPSPTQRATWQRMRHDRDLAPSFMWCVFLVRFFCFLALRTMLMRVPVFVVQGEEWFGWFLGAKVWVSEVGWKHAMVSSRIQEVSSTILWFLVGWWPVLFSREDFVVATPPLRGAAHAPYSKEADSKNWCESQAWPYFK